MVPSMWIIADVVRCNEVKVSMLWRELKQGTGSDMIWFDLKENFLLLEHLRLH